MDIEIILAKSQQAKLLRVAAYARVSADKEAAFHSLSAQKEYYEKYVSSHPNWELVGLYSDNGISGTTSNRPEFQRMLTDCREGMIDLVVTKSITRFARNTVVLLETVRELKTLGVDCYFEKENMHSISPDGELLLTLLAMYAEEEARSASENQIWRIKKRFEQGKPWVGDMLGYRLIDGEMIIIPEEAEIVRKIFEYYISGMGFYKIAKALTLEGIPPQRGDYWAGSTIYQILRNEKYKGDMMLQKTYRRDFISKSSLINHGEKPRYYVRNSHQPIISPELFDAVQQEIAKRKESSDMQKSNSKKCAEPDKLFTGLIVCGDCGGKYLRRFTSDKKYRRPVWICYRFYRIGKHVCQSQQIPESILIAKTKEVLGTEELTKETIAEHVRQIYVPEHNHLVYVLKDGSEVNVTWEHVSRSASWTPEMKERARQQALKRKNSRRTEDESNPNN